MIEVKPKMIYARAIGGPGHGKFLLGRQGLRLNYSSMFGTVPPGHYLSAQIQPQGWRIKLPVWVHESMWAAGQPIVPAGYMQAITWPRTEFCQVPPAGMPSPSGVYW